eukprot:3920844-Rhodomonas_salina.2
MSTAPFTLHSSLFTLHYQPFALHPSLLTRKPARCTIKHSPSTLHLFTHHPSPFTLHPAPFHPCILCPRPFTLQCPSPFTLHPFTHSPITHHPFTRQPSPSSAYQRLASLASSPRTPPAPALHIPNSYYQGTKGTSPQVQGTYANPARYPLRAWAPGTYANLAWYLYPKPRYPLRSYSDPETAKAPKGPPPGTSTRYPAGIQQEPSRYPPQGARYLAARYSAGTRAGTPKRR